MGEQFIRIGVVLPHHQKLSIGQFQVLEHVCASDALRLDAVFLAGDEPKMSPFFSAILALEAIIFARPRSCEAGNFQRRRRELKAIPLPFADPASIELDLVLDMTAAPCAIALAAVARRGVWRLSVNHPYAGFIDASRNAAESIVELLQYQPASEIPCVIARASYSPKFIASRNASFIREKAAQLMIRELKRLARDEKTPALGEEPALPPVAPGIADTARYGARLVKEFSLRVQKKIETRIGLRPGMLMLRYGKGTPKNFERAKGIDIIPTGNRYWADPFLFRRNGEDYIFFEDYSYNTRRGHISVGRIVDGAFEFLGEALRTDYHLSYPLVFEHEGEVYMLPETSQARRIELWKLKTFPDEWELHATALEGVSAADSALFNDSGQWRLFANISNDSYDDHSSELHVFEVGGLDLRSLKPHPQNPVVIDSRSARGGGRVFRHEGKLLRTSQDNAYGQYAYGLNIMEIVKLDSEIYEERLYRRIAPGDLGAFIGCHHVDFSGDAFVMDLRKKRGGRGRRTS